MNLSLEKKAEKKIYTKPILKEYGSVKDHTKAVTAPTGMDGGVAPSNRVMTCVSLPPFIQEHNWLLNDGFTQEAFREALFKTIRPGDVVLDLGTGTGLHALFAVQAGARHVYAVDSESILEFAKQVVQKNGFEKQITLIQSTSESLNLPEKVDVIVTNIGFFNTLKYLPQVIGRHLKPQGRVIPQKITLEFAAVEDAYFYQRNISDWEAPKYGADFSILKNCAIHRPYYGHWLPENLISQPQVLGQVHFNSQDRFEIEFNHSLTMMKDGEFHGIVGWYTFHLTESVCFSTKPPLRSSPSIWNQWFLPLSQPRKVKAGESLDVRVQMNFSEDLPEPLWQWQVAAEELQSNFKTYFFDKRPVFKAHLASAHPTS